MGNKGVCKDSTMDTISEWNGKSDVSKLSLA
jgi:hypothetical protein